jgi:transposase
MTQAPVPHSVPTAPDYDRTLVLAIELSNKSWVLAAQVPGLPRVKAKRTIEPTAEALLAAIQGYRERAHAAGRHIERMVATYEAGWSGFWLARWLATHGIETHVVQPSSVPVDRRVRRAKSDGIDAELLLRTLLAWLRGEPRVCSMVPIPPEADEDARRCVREREELVAERVALVNRIGAVLATLGVGDYNPLLRNRRERLDALHTALGTSLPPHAHAKISRMLDRLDLVRAQIADLEQERDAVLEDEVPDQAGKMIQQLATLRGIGVQSATVLVREAFVREFANGKGARVLRGPDCDALQQRRHGTRAGHQQGREPAAAYRDGRTGLAVAALPARLRRGQLVPRARRRHGSAHAQGDGGGARAKAADRLVAVCHARCGAGRCGHEARVLSRAKS